MTRKINELPGKIKKDLLDQLDCNGTVGAYYHNLVDDYMACWKIRGELQKDIADRGAKVEKFDSRGQKQLVNNESIDQLLKVQATMLKLLESLGIHAVDGDSASGVDGDDL